MGLFDWLRRGRARAEEAGPLVRREGDEVVVVEGEREVRVRLAEASAIRVVPLAGGGVHGSAGRGRGWQVAVRSGGGDIPVGRPRRDSEAALELARAISQTGGVPLDDTTARLFQRARDTGD